MKRLELITSLGQKVQVLTGLEYEFLALPKAIGDIEDESLALPNVGGSLRLIFLVGWL